MAMNEKNKAIFEANRGKKNGTKKAQTRDHRTVLVAFKCSKCNSFVRERIDRDYLEDFKTAVMAKTIVCGCGSK